QVHAAEAAPVNASGTGPTVSRASLQTDLANAQEQGIRLATRVRLLEQRLSEVLGEQAWRESGLGAPDDIEQLKKRVVHLEQQVTDLRLQLNERTDELAAARATQPPPHDQPQRPRHRTRGAPTDCLAAR